MPFTPNGCVARIFTNHGNQGQFTGTAVHYANLKTIIGAIRRQLSGDRNAISLGVLRCAERLAHVVVIPTAIARYMKTIAQAASSSSRPLPTAILKRIARWG